ncbi:YjbH domain-containing protein [Vibrio parahaemolyticus]|uniref:YjbH domain-containing protein n=1 Tax=Vibrio parahaemolyticus TaxID=670 RepID=UPI0007A05E72|nr:YjbH domain-containing protein [Vibrio parahaemolyticus]EGQ7738574.1 YjbH domain-containing protein [Vibrio parahaemolyticus]EGR1765840.1 YjbH domain-containing protein [Vibrio parahaemolyticus]EJG1397845.1 YjbH domain-containing protein [Vibrio parahaemolyticus]ELA9839468.1 YjbH domain-containing protein [Vibrio parahaemolyticus]ELC0704735.1 YjbH domain-containing protein [Vibrio parahaemolyticus]
MKLIKSTFVLTTMSPLIAWAQSIPFEAPPLKPSQMDYGGVGLMQMPTGRMAPEGEFNFSVTSNNEYLFYNATIQVMPWAEATIRYTIVDGLPYCTDPRFCGDNEYTDKGIDFKFRLLEESQYVPEVSFGIRDFAGTGLFDSEYFAATKQYSNKNLGTFDFTLGIGWGSLGSRGNITNPACKISDRFCNRPDDYQLTGGTTNYDRFFKGPAALFGGIEYQTLHEPLRFKVEYDSNDYSGDFPVVQGGIDMTPHTPWNFGALYRVGIADFRLSYERGDTLVAGLTLSTNFNDMPSFWRDTPTPEVKDNQPEELSDVDWERVTEDLDKIAGYKQTQVFVNGNTVSVVGEQKKYRDRNEAHEKAAAVLYNEMPTHIDTYTINERSRGLIGEQTIISKDKYRDFAEVNYITPAIEDATSTSSEKPKGKPAYDDFERFDWGFAPKLVQTLGNAEDFYLFSVGLSGNASYWLTDNLEIGGSLYWDWYNNYDKFNYVTPPDGTTVPRVRTMFRAYQNEHAVTMSNLQLTWFQEYSNTMDQQFYAGYLESMFAGVGTEFLYRPQGANWAIGADVNVISQRDPQSYFGVYDEKWQNVPEYGRPFQVIDKGFTGFVSGYYYPQWDFLQDLMIQVDVGQFLAGDVGTQINVSKQFKSGVIAGAFASFTDLSAEEFGEGSFTKGFYLSIPFDIMTVKPSNNRANFSWQPLTRDGGQKLGRKYNLIELTDERNPWYQRPNTSPVK